MNTSLEHGGSKVDVLYTDIGRGHPFYLDGILQSLPDNARGDVTTVFEATSGLARTMWQGARAVYRLGSSMGGQDSLYSRLRHAGDYSTPGPLLRCAGRPLTSRFSRGDRPLVVAHPILTALLSDHPRLVYQHGEVVVPPECFVKGQHMVLAPTDEAANAFRDSGVDRSRITVTGLCIEPGLAPLAEEARQLRLQRYATDTPLTGAFFSSGAEPGAHVASLVEAAASAVLHGGSVLLIAARGARYARHAENTFARRGLTLVHEAEAIPPAGALLKTYTDRAQLDRITQRYFPQFDYFVAPAHERTNWAIGLGLPMFILEPAIGTFAPMNRALLLRNGVAVPLSNSSGAFGKRLATMRQEGDLGALTEAGWGRYPIDGFKTAADHVAGMTD